MNTDTTAATVISRSSTPVTTRSGLWIGFPTTMFTADVTLDGIAYTYLFEGADHHDTNAQAVGRIRRAGIAHWEGTHRDGSGTRMTTQDSILRALVAYHNRRAA